MCNRIKLQTVFGCCRYAIKLISYSYLIFETTGRNYSFVLIKYNTEDT